MTNNIFTLNSGNTYEMTSKGYYFATINGKKMRCGKASYEMAKSQFEREEIERKLDDAAEDSSVTVEKFCEMVDESETTEKVKEIADMYVRHPHGTDLDKPAAINQHGCVDCSKCNVEDCVHRNCMRRNPTNIGGLAECPRLRAKDEEPKAKRRTNKRVSKNTAWGKIVNGVDVSLTAKQVDFIHHLPDTYFWEDGLDSVIWVDCLCDDIEGQFAGKPMTVGAMISTLCEKGLGTRATERKGPRGGKATSFGLTELGKKVAAELGLH